MNPKSTSAYLFASIRANFIAPKFIKSELEEHKSECLTKSGLSEQQFEIRLAEVEESIDFIASLEYGLFFEKAADLISDPDDIDFISLALSTNSPIWSNDPHFKEQLLVKVYNTKDLLKMFLNNKI